YTIGSFPQTSDIRKARADHRAGNLSDEQYVEELRKEVANVIELQERLGLDVLVHGEPERNDMVQYFAELLDGFVVTENGWVQSYGSRCTRPPFVVAVVYLQHTEIVESYMYAPSMSQSNVKAMLTSPEFIMACHLGADDVYETQ